MYTAFNDTRLREVLTIIMTVLSEDVLDFIISEVRENELLLLKKRYRQEVRDIIACRHCQFCNEFSNWANSIGRRQCRRHPGRLVQGNEGPLWTCCNQAYDGLDIDCRSQSVKQCHGRQGCMRADHDFGTSSTHYLGLSKEVTMPLGLVIVIKKLDREHKTLRRNIISVHLVEGEDKSQSSRSSHAVKVGDYYTLNKRLDEQVAMGDDRVDNGMDFDNDLNITCSNTMLSWGGGGDSQCLSLSKSKVTFSLMDTRFTQVN